MSEQRFVDTQPKFPQQTTQTERPRLTVGEIAKRTGRSKRTVQRHLEAGKFPGAEMVDGIWRIPLEEVLAAGLPLDRVQNPEPVKPRAADDSEPLTWKERALQAEARAEGLRAEIETLKESLEDARNNKETLKELLERLTPPQSGIEATEQDKRRGWFGRK